MGEKTVLSECKEGDILASDVINLDGEVLAAKNIVLNRFIIEQLYELGINSVFIYKTIPNSKEEIAHSELIESYRNSVLQTKECLQNLAAGKPLDFKQISLIADQIHNSINENSNNTIKLLTEIKSSDEYTYTHSVNTAFYSMLIGKWLNLPEQGINKAIQSGLLHDVGKTRIPDEILNKAGRLSNEEYDIIKNHTVLGYEIVKDVGEIDKDVKAAVLLHHERMDGSGYPFHYLEDHMNLYSRIVALADVFDAMTSDRVYKKRATPFAVFDMYQTEGVCQFDIKLLNVFMNNLAVHLIGSNVLLSNGKTGEIVYIPFHKVTSPIVKVASEYLDLSEQKTVQILSLV